VPTQISSGLENAYRSSFLKSALSLSFFSQLHSREASGRALMPQ
jgi:hypothetical protein